MGIESILGAVAGPVIGGLLGGSSSGGSPSGSQTVTNRTEIDPRMQQILYGRGRTLRDTIAPIYGNNGTPQNTAPSQPYPGVDSGYSQEQWNAMFAPSSQQSQELMNPDSDYTTDSGLIGRITGLLDHPQDSALAQFGNQSNVWLGQNGQQSLNNMQASANELLRGGLYAPAMSGATVASTPAMQAAQMQAAQINAPGQNSTNLTPAYTDMIYGDPGANSYLTGGIQRGINQSSNAFSDMLSSATRNITESILPSIRSGARASGSYGGNREALAEGKALDSFNTQIGQALTRFGQGNTDAAVAAQAGAYDTDRNRALTAMGGLSGNQYGVATQDAGFQQQANANNAGFQQDAARTNYGGLLQTNLADAGFQQQANVNNQQSELATNQLNSNRIQAGLSANSGLLGQTYGFGTNQDGYDLSHTGQVTGLLTPFTGLGATQSTTQPTYSNQGAGILGGAMMGQQLARGFGGMNSSNPLSNSNADSFNFFSNNYTPANYG